MRRSAGHGRQASGLSLGKQARRLFAMTAWKAVFHLKFPSPRSSGFVEPAEAIFEICGMAIGV
jgi:hypothetical protein